MRKTAPYEPASNRQARLINALIKQHDFTYSELGKRLGAASSTVWRIERGITRSNRTVITEKLERLAFDYGVLKYVQGDQ